MAKVRSISADFFFFLVFAECEAVQWLAGNESNECGGSNVPKATFTLALKKLAPDSKSSLFLQRKKVVYFYDIKRGRDLTNN